MPVWTEDNFPELALPFYMGALKTQYSVLRLAGAGILLSHSVSPISLRLAVAYIYISS